MRGKSAVSAILKNLAHSGKSHQHQAAQFRAILLAMQIDAFSESLRLAEEYRTKSDGELRELGADFEDLTEPAQQALRSEMHSRGLGDSGSPKARVKSSTSASDGPVPDATEDEANGTGADYTWKTSLCECNSYKEAWCIHAVLAQAGIESWIERQGSRNPEPWAGEFMTGELQVLVAADQLERAQDVAAKPIPQEIIDLSNEKTPDYETPKCPRCGAADPVLEGVDPENTWHCEQCDSQWTEKLLKASGGASETNPKHP
jgi:hypothetical protein